jgi:NAD(P)-dependent dehydrogenase (short-subunit alcohol dehydrogenase family)
MTIQSTDVPRLALVTGGGRGLGRSTALSLARGGTDIILTYLNNKEAAETVAREIESLGRKAGVLQLDVGNVGSFPGFAAALREVLQSKWSTDRFDALVNNGGVGLTAPFTDTTEAIFDELMNVHLKGVFFLTQTLLPLINDGGRIVNLSSGLARFSLPGFSAYGAMKGGIEVLTRYLAKELGQRGITVNAVAPGAIATDFGGGAVRDNPDLNAFAASQTALGRVGEADDIGLMIAALVTGANRWVNGQRIEVSGGMFL